MTEQSKSKQIQEHPSLVDHGGHYRFEYKGIKLDPARIVTIYGCDNLMAGTIVKKALLAGRRGPKDTIQDLNDIICAAERWIEMIKEDDYGTEQVRDDELEQFDRSTSDVDSPISGSPVSESLRSGDIRRREDGEGARTERQGKSIVDDGQQASAKEVCRHNDSSCRCV